MIRPQSDSEFEVMIVAPSSNSGDISLIFVNGYKPIGFDVDLVGIDKIIAFFVDFFVQVKGCVGNGSRQ